MATNITLNNVATFTNDSSAVTTVNANSSAITTAFQDVLSRSGTSPNVMNASLDMNSNRILNLPSALNPTDPVRLIDLNALGGFGISLSNSWVNTQYFPGGIVFNAAPIYNLASNILACPYLIPLDTQAHSVPASDTLSIMRMSQSNGGNNQITVGANAVAMGFAAYLEGLSGSDATSNLYSVVSNAQNDGPGTVKSFHAFTNASGTSSGVSMAASFGLTPVSTSNTGSAVIQVSLISSGVGNGIATGIMLQTTASDQLFYGIGNVVAPVSIQNAFYSAWMASTSAANARAFQVRNNAGTEIAFWNNDGSMNWTPPSGTNTQGINYAITTPNTGNQGSTQINANSIIVTDGNNLSSSAYSTALLVQQTLNTNILGQKTPLYVASLRNQGATSTTGDQIGTVVFAQTSVSNGGTNTGAGASGAIYGLNSICSVVAGGGGTHATNYNIWSGGEVDMANTDASASVSKRVGLSIINAGGTTQGASLDGALEISGTSTAGAWQNVILFSTWRSSGTMPPMSTTGNIIGSDGVAQTIGSIINLPNWTITNNILLTPNTQITGSGEFWGNGPFVSRGNTALASGGDLNASFQSTNATNMGMFVGSGAPTISTHQGSIYLRSDGAAQTRAYVNTSGSNTWDAIPSASDMFSQRYVLRSVNFNSANTDNSLAIVLPQGITRYTLQGVRISNASASISTATIGVFTATGGGGTAMAANQSISVTASATDTVNNLMALTIANNGIIAYNDSTIYVRIGTAQGSAATADVIVNIIPLS